MFFWNSLAFSMIQQMLAIWSLVPLPFLNLAVLQQTLDEFIICQVIQTSSTVVLDQQPSPGNLLEIQVLGLIKNKVS